MNIIVKPYGSDLCYCRPDTTWERENKDFYIPDSVRELYWTPILFARISKAGKCINPKFASRYYDSFNFGVLLYCGTEIAFASCADHTSILPSPLYDRVVMENEENRYEVWRNGEPVFSATADKGAIEDAICRASQLTSVRIGDYVAVELDAIKLLASEGTDALRLNATCCENTIYDFKLIR